MLRPKKREWLILTCALPLVLIMLLVDSCEPLATGWPDVTDAEYMDSEDLNPPPDTFNTIKVMTWNIRFGIGRLPWFGDACGSRVVFSEEEIIDGMAGIVEVINELKPDILLLQEVDVNSLRSAYVDQLKWILDHTYLKHAVYGYQWKTQFIPSDGLGRLHEVNAILSRWKITDAKRIHLELRGDQDALTRYFYERCCIVKGKIEIPGVQDFYVLNAHSSAFATDSTKRNHIIRFNQELDNVHDAGAWFIAGGDLNTLPPGSDLTDYCLEDMCPGESYHNTSDDPMHKEGSNYTPEKGWLTDLYNNYNCAIPLDKYLLNQPLYFTHTVRPGHTWDRTLDYLFTNYQWVDNSGMARQYALEQSDHAPVTGVFILPKIKK
ncbi:MAG: endonuclease/exonuclease/phosphatase family protein [Bacteroidales bacterium]|nr:endonuclease/exonuclease/phosphatase family protein [Bacteroidales bacterium]